MAIVARSVQLAKDGKVIRVHPIRHDRSRELGACAWTGLQVALPGVVQVLDRQRRLGGPQLVQVRRDPLGEPVTHAVQRRAVIPASGPLPRRAHARTARPPATA